MEERNKSGETRGKNGNIKGKNKRENNKRENLWRFRERKCAWESNENCIKTLFPWAWRATQCLPFCAIPCLPPPAKEREGHGRGDRLDGWEGQKWANATAGPTSGNKCCTFLHCKFIAFTLVWLFGKNIFKNLNNFFLQNWE